jgi:hypothetical protein
MPSWLAALLAPLTARGWRGLAGQSSTQLFSSLTQVIDVICSKLSWLSDMKPDVLCWQQKYCVGATHSQGLEKAGRPEQHAAVQQLDTGDYFHLFQEVSYLSDVELHALCWRHSLLGDGRGCGFARAACSCSEA